MVNNSGVRLFAGLGNPGAQYLATRHNAGFWWIDQIAAQLSCRLNNETKFFGETGRHQSTEHDAWLLKPTTFMNSSGRSVVALARFYKILPHNILVIHDEMDLPVGRIKLKKGGGHGGHNGLKDIIACLGSSDFWRLRIGIGRPEDRSQVIGYVLNPPRREEQALIDAAMDASSEILPELFSGQMEAAMLKLHTR